MSPSICRVKTIAMTQASFLAGARASHPGCPSDRGARPAGKRSSPATRGSSAFRRWAGDGPDRAIRSGRRPGLRVAAAVLTGEFVGGSRSCSSWRAKGCYAQVVERCPALIQAMQGHTDRANHTGHYSGSQDLALTRPGATSWVLEDLGRKSRRKPSHNTESHHRCRAVYSFRLGQDIKHSADRSRRGHDSFTVLITARQNVPRCSRTSHFWIDYLHGKTLKFSQPSVRCGMCWP